MANDDEATVERGVDVGNLEDDVLDVIILELGSMLAMTVILSVHEMSNQRVD